MSKKYTRAQERELDACKWIPMQDGAIVFANANGFILAHVKESEVAPGYWVATAPRPARNDLVHQAMFVSMQDAKGCTEGAVVSALFAPLPPYFKFPVTPSPTTDDLAGSRSVSASEAPTVEKQAQTEESMRNKTEENPREI